jgi:hypothetical protein
LSRISLKPSRSVVACKGNNTRGLRSG